MSSSAPLSPPDAPETAARPVPDGIRVSRVLGRVAGPSPGPTLVAVGSLHGNEPAGALALQRIFEQLGGRRDGVRGAFVGLAGNIKALAANRRYLREDLNRIWLPERLAAVRAADGPLHDEDEELASLDAEFTRATRDARGPLIVFDLHSVSGPGPAFVTLDDTLANRALAFRIPAPCVLGLEEELQGTLTDYFVRAGVPSFGFESGQLYDPRSVDRAEAAVWLILEATGILAGSTWPQIARARAFLAAESRAFPPVVEVRHRHAIAPGDTFEMRPGFTSFQRVEAGQVLATNATGAVRAPLGGLILMPLYQPQGSDGFFVVRRVHRFWLYASSLLRQLPAHGLLAWLPGVTRHPDLPGGYIVDTRKARWLARQLFHLLGYKRREQLPHGLVMTRRGG